MKVFKNFCQPRSSFFQKQQENQAMKPVSQYMFTNKNQQINRFPHEYDNRWVEPQRNNRPYQMMNSPLLSQKKISFKDIPLDDRNFSSYPNQNVSNINDQIQRYKIPPKSYNQINQGAQSKQHYFQNGHNMYSPPVFKQFQTPMRSNADFRTRNNQQMIKKYENNVNNSFRQELNRTLIEENHHLLDQNHKLKMMIQNQYKPLKQLYQKLIKQQQDRDYLITKLQWKVKQLVKEMNPTIQKGVDRHQHFGQVQRQNDRNNLNGDFTISNNNFYREPKNNIYQNQRTIQNRRINTQASNLEYSRNQQPGFSTPNSNFRYNNFNQISMIQRKIS